MSPIVSIQNLTHHFGKGALRRQVLHDVTLNLYPGEVVILEGPSGGGKTTLLTLIGALRSVQNGSLKILGQELHGASKRRQIQTRNQIGFIFQAHNLLACLRSWENVSTSLKLHRHISVHEYRRRSVEILTAVGLADHVDKFPENLSGGQKQRVAIARALASHPKLVLADEPTSSLDSKTGRDVVEIMQSLAREEGCTVLLVTHDNRILDVADRILHMEDGRLTENPLS
ncbi:MAG: DevA family ABC transporter ATP-binding protein [Leptolyngbya sp. SIO1E4]|nr:DevA family ABC transporter ATP-binding protein [Leptolyngbya sp. SIO1E4]